MHLNISFFKITIFAKLKEIHEIAERLLSNPVIEDFEVQLP